MKTNGIFINLITQMHTCVGQVFSFETCEKDPDWYLRHEWSADEQKQFNDWAVDYLRKKTRWPKRACETEVAWFVLCYGWKTKIVSK